MEEKSEQRHTGEGDRAEQFMARFLKCEPRIHEFILALTGRWADADDILQETATVMWRKYEHFDTLDGFLGWALTVARYQVMSYRLKGARQSAKRAWLSPEIVELIASEMAQEPQDPGPRMDALQNCMTKLTEKQRLMLHLRYEQGALVKDIAGEAGVTVQACYKALNRVHDLLLQCIEKTLASEGVRP